MANFLSTLLSSLGAGPRQVPTPIPSIDPNTGQPVSGPITGDPLGVMGGGFNPEAARSRPPVNLGEILAPQGASSMDVAAATKGMTPELRAPRPRASLVEILGGIADAVATAGGAQPGYQPTIDARLDRERQARMDEINQQVNRQKIQIGEQTIESNQDSLESNARGVLAQVLGAAARSDDPAAVFGELATQAGIDPGKVAAIAQVIQQNPEKTGLIAQALGYSDTPRGSPSSAIQNFAEYQRILAEQGPEAANLFREMSKTDGGMNDYQAATLGLNRAKFAEDVRQNRVEETRKTSPGSDLTNTQRGNVWEKLQQLPNIANQLARVKELAQQMEQQGTSARGVIGGLVPGAIAGGTAEQFDKALALLTSQMRQLTRTPGEGSMSDYESRLAAATVPSRWGSDEGRAESIRNIEALLQGLQSGYSEMLGGGSARAPARRAAPSAAIEEARRRGLIP